MQTPRYSGCLIIQRILVAFICNKYNVLCVRIYIYIFPKDFQKGPTTHKIDGGITIAECSPPGRILFVNESVQRPGESRTVTLQLVGEIKIGYLSHNCSL